MGLLPVCLNNVSRGDASAPLGEFDHSPEREHNRLRELQRVSHNYLIIFMFFNVTSIPARTASRHCAKIRTIVGANCVIFRTNSYTIEINLLIQPSLAFHTFFHIIISHQIHAIEDH